MHQVEVEVEIKPPYKIWNAFTLHYNLEIAEQFMFFIHDHAFIIHHHHNQSIKCLMFDLLATQLSETADRLVWPGRSSAVARRTAPAASRNQPGQAVPYCPG